MFRAQLPDTLVGDGRVCVVGAQTHVSLPHEVPPSLASRVAALILVGHPATWHQPPHARALLIINKIIRYFIGASLLLE